MGRVARWLTPTDQMTGPHIAKQIEESDLVCNNFCNIERGEVERTEANTQRTACCLILTRGEINM